MGSGKGPDRIELFQKLGECVYVERWGEQGYFHEHSPRVPVAMSVSKIDKIPDRR
jgi:hypothetical protein